MPSLPIAGGCSWDGEDLILVIRAQPRARRDEVLGIHEGVLEVRLQAPPVDGKANARLIKFLAKELGVSRSQIQLLAGGTSRIKRLRVRAPLRLADSWAERLAGRNR